MGCDGYHSTVTAGQQLAPIVHRSPSCVAMRTGWRDCDFHTIPSPLCIAVIQRWTPRSLNAAGEELKMRESSGKLDGNKGATRATRVMVAALLRIFRS